MDSRRVGKALMLGAWSDWDGWAFVFGFEIPGFMSVGIGSGNVGGSPGSCSGER